MTNEEAIRVFDTLKTTVKNQPSYVYEALDVAYKTLKNERQKGKWIHNELGYLICSNCGYDCLYDEEGLYSLGCFCHHCGADMRGE